jgi:hypothetical protein
MNFRLKPLTTLLISLSGVMTAGVSFAADSWGPLVNLRDNTNAFPDASKPADGWVVTPIHATLLADGKVLITGWGRRDLNSCSAGGSRRNGTSFVLDPNNLPNGGTLHVQPINEAPQPNTGDVLYCAGHTPIADGRVLHTGGARYTDLGGPSQQEYGLNYSRLYSPSTNSFTKINAAMVGGVSGMEGMAWYPTNTRMPDGKVMVVGGFSRCCDTAFANRSLQTFDPIKNDQGQNPWSLVAAHDSAPSALTPSLRDYVHSFLLPTSININGINRDLAFIGMDGLIMYASSNPSTPSNQRFVAAPNGQRAFGAEDSTAALVITGEIMQMGGTLDNGVAQRVDLYNPTTNTWRSINTSIGRRNPASVLLPDGTVLLVNGGTDWRSFGGDRRSPQIVNVENGTVQTMSPWPNDGLERGYHNFAVLLKDGRVLLGGGISPVGDIGCERNDLRIYSPPYLANGTRPVITNPPALTNMTAGGAALSLNYSGVSLKSSAQGGVVLMALGSQTHSFDQNQRIVKLAYTQQGNTLSITPPANTQLAPPGDYMLYLVAATGAPSVGMTVRIEKPPVAMPTFHLRGTQNNWQEGDLFTPVAGSNTLVEICRNFTAGDANGGPRFKIDPNGGWGDGFPAIDVAAGGWTKVVVDSTNNTIVNTTTQMAANCGSTSTIKRTVVMMYGQTVVGQDMFLRGGIDWGYAKTGLNMDCAQNQWLCAIPMTHNLFVNDPTRANDKHLDWYGAETNQGNVQGSPLVWTTNNANNPKKVAVDGYGYTPLNTYGDHYWMLDVQMDCSKTVNGWFELKNYISNGPGWESNIAQTQFGGLTPPPYASANHFAYCGKINVFKSSQNQPVEIKNF